MWTFHGYRETIINSNPISKIAEMFLFIRFLRQRKSTRQIIRTWIHTRMDSTSPMKAGTTVCQGQLLQLVQCTVGIHFRRPWEHRVRSSTEHTCGGREQMQAYLHSWTGCLVQKLHETTQRKINRGLVPGDGVASTGHNRLPTKLNRGGNQKQVFSSHGGKITCDALGSSLKDSKRWPLSLWREEEEKTISKTLTTRSLLIGVHDLKNITRMDQGIKMI